MKNLLLTISTTALLLVGQSAMALNEDSTGYELLNGIASQVVELPRASYINSAELEFSGGNEIETARTPTFEENHASPFGFSGGNEGNQNY